MNKTTVLLYLIVAAIYISVGLVMLLDSTHNITGLTINQGKTGGYSILAILYFFVGVMILIGTGRLEKIVTQNNESREKERTVDRSKESPTNIALFQKLKEEYGFNDSQGSSRSDDSVWIVRYHAFPLKNGFKLGYIDLSKTVEGFYFSESPGSAIEEVSQRYAISDEEVSVIKIKIAKSVYDGLGIQKVNTSKGIAESIPSKRIKVANKLIHKGLIVFEYYK